jgi:hypothetical protein
VLSVPYLQARCRELGLRFWHVPYPFGREVHLRGVVVAVALRALVCGIQHRSYRQHSWWMFLHSVPTQLVQSSSFKMYF